MNNQKQYRISFKVHGGKTELLDLNYEDKIVFPLILNYDDYEPNNALGSHKGISKCGAVYLSIPVLLPAFQSKLENIFLFVLFNTLDRQVFGNNMIFSKVIEELDYLQKEGILIQQGTKLIRLYFVLALITGDNLGLDSILGFTECFNATYFCRFCLVERKKINTIFHEEDCVLRNIDNYNLLAAKKNF